MNKKEASKLKDSICNRIDGLIDEDIKEEYYYVGNIIESIGEYYILSRVNRKWYAVNLSNGEAFDLSCSKEYIIWNDLEDVFISNIKKVKISCYVLNSNNGCLFEIGTS